MAFIKSLTFLGVLFLSSCSIGAQDKVIRIYQDADRSNHIGSAVAIERGILTALDEVEYQVAGYAIEFVPLDHRGNVLRSKRNYDAFLADDDALIIFSGIHSPPLIRNRKFINENKALTMVPWAAGAPITRYPSSENWIFRVSLDDSRAGRQLVDYALDTVRCAAPHLLLENTPWGASNLVAMSDRLEERDIRPLSVTRFGMNLKDSGADILLQKIAREGNDCILLVGNAIEGGAIVSAMADASPETKMPIISHWGITGGGFFDMVGADRFSRVDLSFVQSCFSFNTELMTSLGEKVLKRAVKLFPDIEGASDVSSPVGFIHAYDATRILLAAIGQAGLSGNMMEDRNAVRKALESLAQPVKGLVKTYNKPFGVYEENLRPNAHEALGPEDYCMAEYNLAGDIVLDQRGADR